MKNFLVVIVFLVSLINLLFAQTNGSISGQVVEFESKKGIEGVQVYIPEIHRLASTDEQGRYLLEDVKPGVYRLNVNRIGYQTYVQTDVVVRPNRVSYLDLELRKAVIALEGTSARAGGLLDSEDSSSNVVSYSSEEIRRAPGSGGDVSRIMMSLPSIAKVNDESNNLIVRGGNPFENTFYIDGIEVPNINHFPHQGGSGGPIGMLNVELIKDVSFHSGGFSSIYGDKLSSVMDITFREGSRKNYQSQLELSFIGVGGVVEGPLFSDRGTMLLSVRRSYLDYVVDWFDLGTTIAPRYGNVQAKMAYNVNPRHKLTVLGVYADDHNRPDRETALENKMTHFGNQDLYQGTFGVSWRAVLSNNTFSNTSVSFTGMLFNEDWFEPSSENLSVKNRSFERTLNLRNVTQSHFSDAYFLEYGFDAKGLAFEYDNYYGETTNFSGDLIPAFTFDKSIRTFKSGIFLNNNLRVSPKLTAIAGVRTDYFDYNQSYTFSPRLALSYALSTQTTVRGAVGLYHQNLPLLLYAQQEENTKLANPEAIHYIIGYERLIGEDTKFTVELYHKQYNNFPLDSAQPALFVIDGSYFEFYESLTDGGVAISSGIEFLVQKKLMDQLYGLASATYFRSRYKGFDGIWRDRGYDNRFAVSVEGGYKPNHFRDFSVRWIYAGGVPFTPFDLERSIEYGRAVYDAERVNEERYPDYHSLNLRFDQRVFFDKSSLTFYISVWNVYNRKNVAGYYWNFEEEKPDTLYQWSVLPVFGIEYGF